MVSGIIIINKEAGPTSHDIVYQVRKIINDKSVKVGHAGTLDPFAEGVLLILVGQTTKLQSQFMNLEKTYLATLKLGETTDTYDATGNKTKNAKCKMQIKKTKIEKVLKQFVGEIKQMPPAFSAIKIKGQRAYKLARKGIKPDLKSRKVKIYEVELRKYEYPYLEIKVRCSKGTYVRSLAHDIGQDLGVGAYLEKLTRTAIGPYKIDQAHNLSQITEKNLPKKILSAKL